MRIRFKPHARSELAAWPRHIDNPEVTRGHWRDVYDNPALPLVLELGCGKGSFLAAHALREPEYNFLGIDLKSEVLLVSKRNIESAFTAAGTGMGNIAITPHNIEQVDAVLAPEDSVHQIYINFCNPWYKSGHAKHRLTHPRQLIQYRHFLRPDGKIYFKTDDDPLYLDSLRYFEMCGFSLLWECRDLHKQEPDWNIRTEHERMFSDEGFLIKACIVQMQPAQLDETHLSRLKDI